MTPDPATLAMDALGLGREPWNDPASRRRGALQASLRCYERARRRALDEVESLLDEVADLDERIAAVKAEMGVSG